MNSDFVKIMGCKRSGTNLLERLIEKYYENVEVIIHQWFGKHTVPSVQQEDDYPEHIKELYQNGQVVCLYIFKNPFSWHVSFNKAYPGHDPEEVAKRWTEKNRNFYNFVNGRKNILFYYRHLLQSPNWMFRFLDKRIQETKSKEVNLPGERVSKQGKQKRETSFDPDYYLKDEYLSDLTSDQFEAIKKHTSEKLVSNLHLMNEFLRLKKEYEVYYA